MKTLQQTCTNIVLLPLKSTTVPKRISPLLSLVPYRRESVNQAKDETGKPKSVEYEYSWEDGTHTLHGAGPTKQQNGAESACKTRRTSGKRA
jgi:hypothetical protein